MDNLTAGNPRAHRVRVYYEGDEDTIYEGAPLCYNFNTTENWFGGSVSDGVITASGTTAEGSQNEGKYIRVTNPIVISTTSGTPANRSKTITGSTSDFDELQVGMFVNITGTDVTNGTYKVTDVSRSTESAVTNSDVTLDMTAATGTTADVTVELNNFVFFAGVVTKGGWCGKTGPKVLDIYVPNEAIVPIRAYVDCNDKDVLYLVNGANYVNKTALSGALVAVAAEDYNRATTAGLILARLVPPANIAGAALTAYSAGGDSGLASTVTRVGEIQDRLQALGLIGAGD